VEIDWRLVLFEVINFAVLMALLARFLLRPVRETLAARREELEARDRAVGEREAAAGALREEYAGKLRDLEAEAGQRRLEARERAEAEAGRIVAAARRDAGGVVASAREEAEALRRKALRAVAEDVPRLAVQAAGRVVEGLGEPDIARIYARRGAERLLAEADVAEDAPIQVWVSPDADPERVRASVREVAGDRREVEVEVDGALVGGARLAAGTVEVTASAGAALAAWLAEVAGAPGDGDGAAAEAPA